MLAHSDLVELLDRKFDFLMRSDQFMLDLSRFVDFLKNHYQIKYYTEKMVMQYRKERDNYAIIMEGEKNKFIDLSGRFRAKYLELDDSNRVFADIWGESEYDDSFVHFDDIISGRDRLPVIGGTIALNKDLSDVKKLMDIIEHKIHKYEEPETEGKKREIDNKIWLDFVNLKEARTYNHKKWLNSCRVMGGRSLEELIAEIEKINPKPRIYKNLRERALVTFEDDPLVVKELLIQAATYDEIVDSSGQGGADAVQNYVQTVKNRIQRVYEAVREEISTSLLHRQLLGKYKTRCEWYERNEFYQKISQNSKPEEEEKKAKKEDMLSMHLACFLFDNGIPVLYRLKAGNKEMDMVDPDAKNPLLIEAKVFEDSNDVSRLKDGFAQLYTYIINLTSKVEISECFYVIYRLGGNFPIIPEQIKVGKHIINTVVIDLGKSSESGSKQKKLAEIKESDFIEVVERLQATPSKT